MVTVQDLRTHAEKQTRSHHPDRFRGERGLRSAPGRSIRRKDHPGAVWKPSVIRMCSMAYVQCNIRYNTRTE